MHFLARLFYNRRRCKQASKLVSNYTLATTRIYDKCKSNMLPSIKHTSEIAPPTPSEPFYETVIVDSDGVSSCSAYSVVKIQEQSTTTMSSKYDRLLRSLMWTRGENANRYHGLNHHCDDDQRRSLFRHSDDDVEGYIIRTKL